MGTFGPEHLIHGYLDRLLEVGCKEGGAASGNGTGTVCVDARKVELGIKGMWRLLLPPLSRKALEMRFARVQTPSLLLLQHRSSRHVGPRCL